MAMGATTYQWVLEHDRLLEDPEKWHGYYGVGDHLERPNRQRQLAAASPAQA
jgi:hypothetical protein